MALLFTIYEPHPLEESSTFIPLPLKGKGELKKKEGLSPLLDCRLGTSAR